MPPVQDHPRRHPDPARGEAEVAWGLRYAEPDRLRAAIDATPADTPLGRVLRAFVAWRTARPEEATALVEPVLDLPDLPLVWRARARGIYAAVLGETGLVQPALTSQLEEQRLAEASGDPIARLAVTHDLGITLETVNPERATEQLRAAMRDAVPLLDVPGAVGRQAHAVYALAITNLRAQGIDRGEPLDELPTLDEAAAHARLSWPDLAGAVTALQVMELLDHGDLAAARQAAAALPDPDRMRDATHAGNVERALALIAAAEGDDLRARDGFTRAARRVAPRFRQAVLEDLVETNRRLGDLEAALAASEERFATMVAYHAAETRMSVRALEVQMRTRDALERADALTDRVRVLHETVRTLRADRDALREEARRDVLTGLWNRAHLRVVGPRLEETTGHQVAVVDIDDFKGVNDAHGHAVGDAVLVAVARRLLDLTGPGDLCLRLGGDEMVVVRPAGDPRPLARDLAGACVVPAGPGTPGITLSVGVVRTGPGGVPDALERADRLMYQAKHAGGGRVVE